MSQLRNLLTNSERIRSEITEQRALAASQFVPKSQPKPGFLRRVGNFLNRAFKGA